MLKNDYFNHVVKCAITRNLQSFKRPVKFGPSKRSVYLLLARHCFDKVGKTHYVSVFRCYFAVEPRVVFTTSQLLPRYKKDVFPAFQLNNIIYQHLCHCDSRYEVEHPKVCRTGSKSMYQRTP